jgi:hypothetical protein
MRRSVSIAAWVAVLAGAVAASAWWRSWWRFKPPPVLTGVSSGLAPIVPRCW